MKLAAAYIACGVAADRAIALARGGTAMKDRDRYWQINALLHVLGVNPYQPGGVEWDHEPPIALRAINAEGTDYDPPQLDPAHITPRGYVDHRTKTSGTPAGQKVVTVANGDIHRIAKAKRLEEARLTRFEHTEVRMVLGEGEQSRKQSQPWPKGRKMQGRGFAKKRTDG